MRITDIISESKEKKLSKASREAAPHAKQFQGIDQYYQMYRMYFWTNILNQNNHFGK
jgi:hypothetical protein